MLIYLGLFGLIGYKGKHNSSILENYVENEL
jgi:hypothetical protein